MRAIEMQVMDLSGPYHYEQFRTSNLTDVEIDASGASWIVANTGDMVNKYPFLVTDSSNIILTGGVIDGEVSLETDWVDAYINSAAVHARDSESVTFRDWTISEAWDGIRITGEDDATFAIDNVWMTNIRDDAVENDDGLSGTITNSLFDGVFVGISLYDANTNDQTDQTVRLDNVLIRMEAFEYKGEMTHQPFFKYSGDVSPQLEIHNSVFAIEDVDHRGYARLEAAWDNVTASSNNVFLNLSDTPLPDDYPMPPEGFTILQGEDARAFWEDARDEWMETYRPEDMPEEPVDDPVDDPTPDDPVEDPAPEPTPEDPVEDPAPEPTPDDPIEDPAPDPTPEDSVEDPAPEPEGGNAFGKAKIAVVKCFSSFSSSGKGPKKHISEEDDQAVEQDETIVEEGQFSSFMPMIEVPEYQHGVIEEEYIADDLFDMI